MIFKTIEDEAGKTAVNVTKIFSELKNEKNALFAEASTESDFRFTDSLEQYNEMKYAIDLDKQAIESFIQSVQAGASREEALAESFRDASSGAKEYASSLSALKIRTMDATSAAVKFEAQQKMASVTTKAQNKSLTNTRTLITEYNAILSDSIHKNDENYVALSKSGLKQEDFVEAVKQSNPQLATYLTSLRAADGTTKGYVGSLISAKLQTIGLKIETIALNAVVGVGIGLLMSLLSMGLQSAIEAIADALKDPKEALKELDEELSSLQSTIQSTARDFSDLKKNSDEIIPRFAELAKGVDEFGNRLTDANGKMILTDEEYEEFWELNNKIAEMFPDLDVGIDSNGNHILSLSYSVDTLTESLEALVEAERQAANQKIIENLDDTLENIEKAEKAYKKEATMITGESNHLTSAYNTVQSYGDAGFSWNTSDRSDRNADRYKAKAYKDALDALGIKYTVSQSGYNPTTRVYDIENIIPDDADWDRILREYENDLDGFSKEVEDTNAKAAARWKKLNPIMGAWLQTTDSYAIATDEIQNLLSKVIGNINYGDIGITDGDELKEYLQDNVIDTLMDASLDVQDAVKRLFLNDGELSINEFESLADKIKEQFGEDNPVYLYVKTNLDDAGEMVNTVKSFIKDEFDSSIDELSLDDLEIAASDDFWKFLNVPEDTQLSIDELKQKLKEFKESSDEIEPLSSLDTLSKVNALSDGLDQLGKIYDDVSNKEGFDFSSLFSDDFKTTFGELDSYESFIKTISESPDDIKACQEAFNRLAGEYINSKDALEALTDENKNNAIAILKNMGVANAEALVERQLAVNKEKVRLETERETEATYDDILSKYEEAEAGSVAQQALAQLAIEKFNLNNTRLDVTNDINSLISLANAAGVTAEVMSQMITLQTEYNEAISGAKPMTPRIAGIPQYIKSLLTDPSNYLKIDPNDFIFSGGGKNSGSGGTSGGTSGGKKTLTPLEKFNNYTSKLFDWAEIRLNRLKTKTDKYLDKAEKRLEEGKFDSAKSSYKSALSSISSEIKANNKAAGLYNDEANKVLDTAISKGVISKKQASNIKKKIKDGSLNISELSDGAQTVAKAYQEYYEKSLEAKDKVVDLNNKYAEIAESIYNLPLDKAAKKVEKYKDNIDTLNAQLAIEGDFEGKNSVIDQITNREKKILKAYNTAADEATSSVNSLWKNKYLKEALNTDSNKDKSKGEKLSTSGLEKGSKQYNAVIKYNEAIEAQKEALEDAKKAGYEYTATLQENTKAKFDNIKTAYESNQNPQKSEISWTMAKIERQVELGRSTTSGTLEGYYKTAIEENEALLSSQKEEVKTLQAEYKKNKSKMSEEDRKAAESEIYELKAEILGTEVEIGNLNEALVNLPVERLKNELSQIQAKSNEVQDAITLRESKGGSATEEDYEQLIEYSEKEVENLRLQIDELTKQRDTYAKSSQKYRELQSQIDDVNKSIREETKNQVEYNNAIINMPIEKIEKELELLDSILAFNKSEIELKVSLGKDLSEEDYMKQIADNEEIINKKNEKRMNARNNYIASFFSTDGFYGGKTTAEWVAEFEDLGKEINELTIRNEELKDSLRDDVYWRTYERAHEEAKKYEDILSSIKDLISEDMYYDKDGNITDFGLSQIAVLTSQYSAAQKEIENFSNDISNLNKLFAEGQYTQEEYIEKMSELRSGLLSSAKDMKSISNEIIDIYKNMGQKELDSLFKLIDARNEALSAKKSYYEYDKTIKEKTKDIRSLQAQIAALEGVNTAEAKAKKARLNADLTEMQEGLNETITEHTMELSTEALSKLKDTLQDSFDDKWDNISGDLDNIAKIITLANTSTVSSIETVNSTLNTLLESYGVSSSLLVDAHFARGTKRVPRNLTALTNENGNEIIVTKEGLITPLSRGDGVIPANLTERLYNLAKNGTSIIPKVNISTPTLTEPRAFNVDVEQHYDSLINIEGSADAATVRDIENMSKDLLQKSYEYTSKKMYGEYIRGGGKRTI